MQNGDRWKPMVEGDCDSGNAFRFSDGLLIRKTIFVIRVLGFMTRQRVRDGQTTITHHRRC